MTPRSSGLIAPLRLRICVDDVQRVPRGLWRPPTKVSYDRQKIIIIRVMSRSQAQEKLTSRWCCVSDSEEVGDVRRRVERGSIPCISKVNNGSSKIARSGRRSAREMS